MDKKYIERDGILGKIKRCVCNDCDKLSRYDTVACQVCETHDAMFYIWNYPTADVVEVKHGTGCGNMKIYEVYGHANVICSMRVKANNEKEAIEIANSEFGGLTNYCGMGGNKHLIGVLTCADNRCVIPDSEVEFDDCQEVSDGNGDK